MSVRRSLIWTYGAQLFSFLIVFASTVVVARLVTPRDFGIYGMAVAATTIINVFMQLGLAKYIMREETVSRDLLRSLFTVNLLMTLVYCCAILIGSVFSTYLFQSQEVGRFLLVFALFPLIAMFEFIPSALAAREMRFGLISAMAVVRAVVLASSTVGLALLGLEYMSFAWAQVLTFAVTAIGFNAAIWRPDVWLLRFSDVRRIAHFGLQMIGISGISQINARLSEMTLGSMLGLGALGLYTRAAGLPGQINGIVFSAGSNVIFSRLSSDLRERGEIHKNYLHFMRLLLGLLWPMMIGIAILAQPIIALLYGAKWQAAAAPLSLLMIATAIAATIGLTAEVFILRHRTKQQVQIEALRAIFGYAAFAAATTVSLTLAAAAKVAEAVFAFLLYRKPMTELVGGPSGALRSVYFEALLMTVAAVLPAGLLMAWFNNAPETPLPYIVAAVAAGVLCWALMLIARRHPLYLELLRVLRRPTAGETSSAT
ncbi:oligosaccharide flippase family protein [Sphingomonas sp. LHG3443-2]|uniref:oligosaccharide flippase family protein n=1 Tax=Sphingomonas sp. LHG3443-2 TaxID=2804639 RepID=UPI003CEFB965